MHPVIKKATYKIRRDEYEGVGVAVGLSPYKNSKSIDLQGYINPYRICVDERFIICYILGGYWINIGIPHYV